MCGNKCFNPFYTTHPPNNYSHVTRTFGRKKTDTEKETTYLKLMYSKWPQNVDNVGYGSEYAQMRIPQHAITTHRCISHKKKKRVNKCISTEHGYLGSNIAKCFGFEKKLMLSSHYAHKYSSGSHKSTSRSL